MMRAHGDQVRKGKNTPYFAHPLAVSALVVECGGDHDQAIAALLHDVVEDCGISPGELHGLFGHRVAGIVEACTDGVPGADGVRPPWRARKEAYLLALPRKRSDAFLVIACDKVHNAESIVHDLAFPPIGMTVFDRFAGGIDGTLWYYDNLFKALEGIPLPPALRHRLGCAVEDMAAGIEALRVPA
jgi:(p)ppGpp synthase/HD superfamily hydrolase